MKTTFRRRVRELSTQVSASAKNSETAAVTSENHLGQLSADKIQEWPTEQSREPEASPRGHGGLAQDSRRNKITDLSAYLKSLEDQASQSEISSDPDKAGINLIEAAERLTPESTSAGAQELRRNNAQYGSDTAAKANNDPQLSDKPSNFRQPACRDCRNAHVSSSSTIPYYLMRG